MDTRADLFIPCPTCEFGELCAWKDACIAARAEANIRAETPPTYPCTKHPERIAVAVGLNCRMCQACLEAAQDHYVNAKRDRYIGTGRYAPNSNYEYVKWRP